MRPGWSYVVGPGIALLAVLVLALILRWIYSDAGAGTKNRAAPSPADYGLLTAVATVPDPVEADRLRARLVAGGVRTTLGRAPEGGVLLLVFAADAERARTLLAPST